MRASLEIRNAERSMHPSAGAQEEATEAALECVDGELAARSVISGTERKLTALVQLGSEIVSTN